MKLTDARIIVALRTDNVPTIEPLEENQLRSEYEFLSSVLPADQAAVVFDRSLTWYDHARVRAMIDIQRDFDARVSRPPSPALKAYCAVVGKASSH